MNLFAIIFSLIFLLFSVICLFIIPAILEDKEQKNNRRFSEPLFSHWKCSNCGHWLIKKEYEAYIKDKGCPNCGTSLLNYEPIIVDTQQKYDEIMGFE